MKYPNLYLGSPKVIAEAVRYLGINEIKGKANNQTIMSWAKNVGVDKIYTSDEIAWCGKYRDWETMSIVTGKQIGRAHV